MYLKEMQHNMSLKKTNVIVAKEWIKI